MNESDTWLNLLIAGMGSFIAAALGVVMRHTHIVQQGGKFSWSRLGLDAPTILVMALIGHVTGQWLTSQYGMPDLFGDVISSILGYLGPSSMDRLLEAFSKRLEGGDK